MNAATLWDAYRKEKDPTARDRLLSHHLRLVHHIARQMARGLRLDAELDDLVSAGTIGLVKAIENYDPTRGIAFSTFAAVRIRGAILDELRRWDHVPRSVRRKQRELRSVRERLADSLEREPRADETARELGIDVEELWRWELEVQDDTHLSLHEPIDRTGGGSGRTLDLVVGDTGSEIEEKVNRDQELEVLRREIMALKERERLVLALYYFEELKLHQIAQVLNLTESRVSQIRSKALNTLRERLAALREG
ncbi:MAG TPA: FliA/WhiG family RNA polymerase sigma factor [Longimicrobiales bacterium]|jgi:RNA polymerase sigma factor for flagellar operon FliA